MNTIISLYYYLRIVKAMYLDQSDRPSIMPNPLGLAISVVCAVMLLALFIGYNRVTNWTQAGAQLYLTTPATPTASAR